jgi:5-oxoprolinase (ATP-hydrolysing) subunit A
MLTLMRFIDLSADLGEGGTEDQALLGLVTSVNIACGGHAGDEETMERCLRSAAAAGVAIGAHPSYEDRENFGRRAMALPLDQVTDLVQRQVAKLTALAAKYDITIHHVKPHGALYHQAGRDPLLAAAVVQAILQISPQLILYAQPGSQLDEVAKAAGLTVCPEGFADRRYRDDGSLMPRGEPGALIKEVDAAVAQAMKIAATGKIKTLCIQGDGPTAVAILKALRVRLCEAGFVLKR